MEINIFQQLALAMIFLGAICGSFVSFLLVSIIKLIYKFLTRKD